LIDSQRLATIIHNPKNSLDEVIHKELLSSESPITISLSFLLDHTAHLCEMHSIPI
jgi:hypothetical protein